MSAEAGGLDGTIEGLWSADFDHVVHPNATGLFEGPGSPVGVLLVVEGGVGAEFLEAGRFLVGTGDGEDAGTVVFGDLEGEDGDAAGALDENGAAGLELAANDESVPGGDGGAGQGGGLSEGHGIWQADEGVGRDSKLLA